MQRWGSNGNGFLFTKPRAPERRAGMNGVVHHAMGLPEIVEMANYFASRGWFFVSVDYRTTIPIMSDADSLHFLI